MPPAKIAVLLVLLSGGSGVAAITLIRHYVSSKLLITNGLCVNFLLGRRAFKAVIV